MEMTMVYSRMTHAFDNPELHHDVIEVFKDVEKVAKQYRELNFLLKNYKMGLIAAEEGKEKQEDMHTGLVNLEGPSSTPKRGSKRKGEDAPSQ